MKRLITLTLMVTLVIGSFSLVAMGKDISGEITVWGWDVAAATFEETLDLFNAEYPNIKVVVEDFSSGNVYEKLTVGLVARGAGLPDVCLIEDERVIGYISQFPDAFINLFDLGFDQHLDLFSESKVEGVSHDGALYAAPWDIGPAGIFYRVDIFEQAGVNADDIVTWDDYLAAGIQIKEKTGVRMLPIDIANYAGLFSVMMQQQGYGYVDQAGEPVLNSPEAKRAMEMIKAFYDNDIILNNRGWNGIVTATVNGDVATVPYGVWYTGTIMDQAPDHEGLWDSFFLPEFKEGSGRYANVGGSAIAIPASTRNQEAAYAFVEFFTTNIEAQLYGFEKYGLFPSLQSTYESEILVANNKFFNNKPIFKNFADIVSLVPAINTTKDYGRIGDLMADTQASILLEGKPIDEALDAVNKQVKELR